MRGNLVTHDMSDGTQISCSDKYDGLQMRRMPNFRLAVGCKTSAIRKKFYQTTYLLRTFYQFSYPGKITK